MPRWTEESRQEQRERIQQQKPWLKSTGPVTRYGRLVSSKNAAKKKRTLSQQLHFGFTARCEKVAEPPISASEVALNVAFVSHTARPLEIGDRVKYTGGFAPTMLACGDSPLEVVGVCRLGTGAIACRTAGGKLIWIYPQDLERV